MNELESNSRGVGRDGGICIWKYAEVEMSQETSGNLGAAWKGGDDLDIVVSVREGAPFYELDKGFESRPFDFREDSSLDLSLVCAYSSHGCDLSEASPVTSSVFRFGILVLWALMVSSGFYGKWRS